MQIYPEKLIRLGLFPAILAYVYLEKIGLLIQSPQCIFQYFFNVDCWGCGMTRAILEIFRLNFKNALLLNPLSPIVIILLFLIFCKELSASRTIKWPNLR